MELLTGTRIQCMGMPMPTHTQSTLTSMARRRGLLIPMLSPSLIPGILEPTDMDTLLMVMVATAMATHPLTLLTSGARRRGLLMPILNLIPTTMELMDMDTLLTAMAAWATAYHMLPLTSGARSKLQLLSKVQGSMEASNKYFGSQMLNTTMRTHIYMENMDAIFLSTCHIKIHFVLSKHAQN